MMRRWRKENAFSRYCRKSAPRPSGSTSNVFTYGRKFRDWPNGATPSPKRIPNVNGLRSDSGIKIMIMKKKLRMPRSAEMRR